MNPSGSGPRVYAEDAKNKIGQTLRRDYLDAADIQIGVLSPNLNGDETETPFAVVCQFNRPISQQTLYKTYQLAWSFSRTQALITVEPHLLRVWTCCETPPGIDQSDSLVPISSISRGDLTAQHDESLSEQASKALYWVELASGQFFKEHEERFQKSQSADHLLLKNLKAVRRELKAQDLDEDIIHDLLARLIFIQFLFHRKDSSGKSALDEKFLYDRFKEGKLSQSFSSLADLLRDHHNTYVFFRLLNEKFNGDLFPGKGETEQEREVEWRLEESQVTQAHLNKLSDFIRGDMEIESGQMSMWPHYAFDAVPLDFISSIYEEFVSKGSDKDTDYAHYTPGHIVDFMLDGVLPWDSTDWNLKILDPACGSGIFLVKAFQRLIYRWKKANPETELRAKTLRSILENCIFGVDLNPHAVRVASFSLYLTMCDQIDPRHYWKTMKFPRLRDCNLLSCDFFSEDVEGINTESDQGKYDLVIGNAPWGRNSASNLAKDWAKKHDWTLTYGNIGPLFLPKSALLSKNSSWISMLQPAGAIIYNQMKTAQKLRKKLFSQYTIHEVTNLSALAYGLFKNSLSPSCIITLGVEKADGSTLTYICPKPVYSVDDEYRVIIEPFDINIINENDFMNPVVWSAFMWGGKRDLHLLKHLSNYESLDKYERNKIVKKRQGIIRGDRKKIQKEIVGRRILDSEKLPDNQFLLINPENLYVNNDPETDSRASTNFEAFKAPQLILKQSWRQELKRFQSAFVNSGEGILCSKSYISIHVPERNKSILHAACISFNSILCNYFVLLTSGRFANYRAEANVEDLLKVPFPQIDQELFASVQDYNDIDTIIRKSFEFKESEWALIEDLFAYTLPDFKGDSNSPGRQKTNRLLDNNLEPELRKFCDYFMRVIKAGFGESRPISAAIFQEKNSERLPVRLVAIYLGHSTENEIEIEPIKTPQLLAQLDSINKTYIDQGNKSGIYYQRVARIYAPTKINGQSIPTIYFIKPDQIRYWTRSMAMRDADEVAAEAMFWQNSKETKS